MDVGKLKDDVRAGRVGGERLLELIERLVARVRELDEKLDAQAVAKVDEPFSMRAEEKRQEQRGKFKRRRKARARRGRVTTADKIRLAERVEKCFSAGVAESHCWLSHTRVAWRLENVVARLAR